MPLLSRAVPKKVMQAQMHFIQKCAAYRLAGIHVLRQPRFMSFLWLLVRPFMSAKMKQRVHFHGEDMGALLQFMDASQLPPELGGTCGDHPMRWLEEQIEAEARGC
jgi:hypothetical protein